MQILNYGGIPVKIEMEEADLIDAPAFERREGVKPGDGYTIISRYSGNPESYVYLGRGWSMCLGSGKGAFYVLPSHNPHYFTRPASEIDPELVSWAIVYILEKIGPQDGYEMEA